MITRVKPIKKGKELKHNSMRHHIFAIIVDLKIFYFNKNIQEALTIISLKCISADINTKVVGRGWLEACAVSLSLNDSFRKALNYIVKPLTFKVKGELFVKEFF